MPLADLVKIIRKNIKKENHNALPNGVLCLKGGELENEIQPFRHHAMITSLDDFYEEEFFKTKKLVYVSL